MSTESRQRHERLIRDVCELARKLSKGRDGKEAGAFCREFYRYAPLEDVAERSVSDLALGALSIWQLGQQRAAGEILTRWLNPRADAGQWNSTRTVIEIVSDDRPFIVDSAINQLTADGLTVHLTIHPVVNVRRNKQGKRVEVLGADAAPDESKVPESYLHIEVTQQNDVEFMDRVVANQRSVMADVEAAVSDWPKMRSRVGSILAELDASRPPIDVKDLQEGKEFLTWLDDRNYTYLGYCEYELCAEDSGRQLRAKPNTGLGVFRDTRRAVTDVIGTENSITEEYAAYIDRPELILIGKAACKATVHRAVYMDLIGVRQFGPSGQVMGGKVFVGLLTSAAHHRSPLTVPLLRRRVDRLLADSGVDPNSHDGKALVHIIETFPRDALFQIADDQLLDISLGILDLQERHRTALFVWQDALRRLVSCLVFVPVERFSTAVRQRVERILEESLGATCASFETRIDQDSVLARLYFIFEVPAGSVPLADVTQIEHALADAVRTFDDRLQDALIAAHGEAMGTPLAQRYSGAFDAAYQTAHDTEQSLNDVVQIEQLSDHQGLGLNLYQVPGEQPHLVRLKIYHRDRPVTLSETLPILEHLGFRALEERPYQVALQDDGIVWIHDFGLAHVDKTPVDLAAVRDTVQAIIQRVWAGKMDSDGFNRLVINASLRWRQIVLLRAYAKFLRQAQMPFSERYVQDTLARHGDVTRRIVQLFEILFDPAAVVDREAESARIEDEIAGGLDAIESLDEDRILRSFFTLVRATLRTNFYQKTATGPPKEYVAIKLDSGRITELPEPRPMAEVFVHSPDMEGVHLRFGKVARGGIRWSDRREDYRTEILGLVKAQQVKNSVIVPVGSKGGFVVKHLPADAPRDQMMERGVAAYQTLVRGLLDVTDNIHDHHVVPPDDVERRDGDDPYLVVAADKGTATFSDYANAVAEEYDFWLGDAFASGGSAGYDHKKMGITARGAWEAVKRHFRELHQDIQSTAFTVVGVGDMSGDVFGNAMLLSEHTCLIGAFNHKHIFIDPNPDPAASYAERQRLFELPRSSWSDYNRACLSAGGDIFDRQAKSITLSAVARARLGIDRSHMTPNELIVELLRAESDLLWFGGIGTYVKARHESNIDVGDRANDALRIDGHEVRAKVIGEGANLGVTPLGRVEYALHGGRINTDAVDNSAGVDCSDHEVNIKILLGASERAGKLNRRQRNHLLAQMEQEVAELVVRDNYMQTGSLSVTKFSEHRLTDRLVNFMRDLERAGHLDRSLERLPDDDTLADRKEKKIGLTRPELCILMAYAKIVLKQQLLESQFPDDPFMLRELEKYFPLPLRKKYTSSIHEHRLHREIIATMTTNSIINRAGITFFHEVREKTGKLACDVARGFVIARQVFDTGQLRREIDGLDNQIKPSLQADMHRQTGRLIARITLWFLKHGSQPLDITAHINEYRDGIQQTMQNLDGMLTDGDRRYLEEYADRFVRQGAPADLARRVACLRILVSACDIVRAGKQLNLAVESVGHNYFRIGELFSIDWLRRQAASLPVDSHWDNQATAALIEDLYNHQYALTYALLKASPESDNPDLVIERCCADRSAAFVAAQQAIKEIRESPKVGLAQLAVANHQLRTLTAS